MDIRGIRIDVLNNWGAEDRMCVPLVQFHVTERWSGAPL
jgi:uncharacterized protein (DUF608 family)